MDIPSFKEDHISQIPALIFLQNLGYQYLSPPEAEALRDNKFNNVLLEDILRSQLRKINSEKHISSTRSTYLSEGNIENAIRALKDLPFNDGYIHSCETVYDLLTLGKTFDQLFDGDKKSITVQYIDWKEPQNNVFHVTEEYSVLRSNSKDHYRPDIVLFINGIPICIIECKRPDIKDNIKSAISQHLRNQQEDGIRGLYVYTQLLMSIATDEASFGTNATEEDFWAKWYEKAETKEEEKHHLESLYKIKNKSLSLKQRDALFTDRFRYVREYFEEQISHPVLVTEQDMYLHSLCRPERLMDLILNYILFDNGIKKITRYQQFFSIKKTLHQITNLENGRRKGGVIWHTQGSGKSLTMVMLAQAIAMAPSIKNPKIILVTDRTDLDDQITKTFGKCGMKVENAATGQQLVDLLYSKSDSVVTTIINKFTAAVNKINAPLTSSEIFVLIDEGHRTQYGIFNIEMQKTLPNACFIAFTGTPLFKKEKSTAAKFGGIIDSYTVDEAVKDKAVVPLLYEGRLAHQDVHESPLDTYFAMITQNFTEQQKVDFKKKFSRADQLNSAEQKMYAIAWDISIHYKENWQGTPSKAQLVCDKKINAIRYKELLDQIGLVSSAVLISSIDDREGEDSAYEKSSDKEKQFWAKMMNEHGNAKSYEKNLISRFKNQNDPEIIIVVDKLITGFDEPKNTVLYLTRNLQGHKLLQAIARVNRIYPDKEFGYIIDYYGVIENLDTALDLYSSLDEFDKADLEGTIHNIAEEINKLPQKHANVWDIFKEVKNKRDVEAFQVVLKEIDIRNDFYEKCSAFAKGLKLALSSIDFHKKVDTKIIDKYKDDLAMFIKLRSAVMERYSDRIDFKQYEGQIQKLIDTHITTIKVSTITDLVNIFDKEKFHQEIENTIGTAAKADKIASRTAKHITEKMDEDPAFYKKFSQMLKEAIEAYEHKRIDETQYLKKVLDIMNNVLNHTDSDIPSTLKDKDIAKAYYGISDDFLSDKIQDETMRKDIAANIALQIDKMILSSIIENGKTIVDWQHKSNLTGRLLIEIGDYLIDEVREKYHIQLDFDEIDQLAEKYLNIAKIRVK